MNIPVIIILSVVVIALVVFLFVKNQKDKRELEKKLNEPAEPRMKKESDIESDDRDKI